MNFEEGTTSTVVHGIWRLFLLQNLGEALERRVEKLHNEWNARGADLYELVRRYDGMLKMNKNDWVPEEQFHSTDKAEANRSIGADDRGPNGAKRMKVSLYIGEHFDVRYKYLSSNICALARCLTQFLHSFANFDTVTGVSRNSRKGRRFALKNGANVPFRFLIAVS